jgi:hypothetical protein
MSDSGPQLTWSVVIAGILAFCALSAGFFTIVQGQFNASDRRIEANEREIEKRLTLREHLAYLQEQKTVNESFIVRLSVLETEQRSLIAHAARNPIEAREVDQLSAAFDKQIAAMRSQIDDINRQIAASILQPGYRGQQSPLR